MTLSLPGSAATMADELDRLTAVYGCGMLDDGQQDALDALVEAAAAMFNCPTAMLTVIDHDTMHIRANKGEPFAPMPREQSVCDHAIREPEGLVVPDLAKDPRFATNPVLSGVRFYAGVPIHAPDRSGRPQPIGALCVIDPSPRTIDDCRHEALRHLARLADVLIAARADAQRAIGIAAEHQALVADLARQQRIFAQAERMAGLGSWRLSLPDNGLEWSEGVYRIYGADPAARPDLRTSLNPYPVEARARIVAALTAAVEGGSFDFEENFYAPNGELRRVHCLGEREQVDGHDVAVVAVIQDVTDRHRLEMALRRDADTDALTGLANRAAFDKALAEAVTNAHQGGTPLALALIDLDGFKAVNDTLGHAAGDDVLRDVGAALRALPIDATITARIGGDEFAVLLAESAVDTNGLAETIERALQVSVNAGESTLFCSGSVGIVLLEDETSPRDFLHRADVALYAAKRARIGERRRAEHRRAA